MTFQPAVSHLSESQNPGRVSQTQTLLEAKITKNGQVINASAERGTQEAHEGSATTQLLCITDTLAQD